jgi:hypothetical protein
MVGFAFTLPASGTTIMRSPIDGWQGRGAVCLHAPRLRHQTAGEALGDGLTLTLPFSYSQIGHNKGRLDNLPRELRPLPPLIPCGIITLDNIFYQE